MGADKKRATILSLLLAGALVASGGAAFASVSTNGSVCQSYYPQETVTGIYHTVNGTQVTASGNTYLVCPISRANPGGSSATVELFFKKGGATTNYSYAYSLDFSGNVVDSANQTWVGSGLNQVGAFTPVLHTVSWGTLGVIALMPKNDMVTMVGVAE